MIILTTQYKKVKKNFSYNSKENKFLTINEIKS